MAAGGWDDLTGTYQLSVIDVTDGVPDDYPEDVHTSGSVAVGGSTRGLVEYRGDVDWFAVTLEGGTNYQIDVRGSWTDYGDAVFDPYLYGVYDADGNLLPDTEDDIGGEGLNSRLWFRPDTSGTYYVAAGCDHGRDSSNVRDEGSYTVAVTDLTPGAGLVAAAALGEPVTGRIEFDYERDWIGVSLEAGTTYRFDLEGYVPSYYDREGQHHGGTLRDPWIPRNLRRSARRDPRHEQQQRRPPLQQPGDVHADRGRRLLHPGGRVRSVSGDVHAALRRGRYHVMPASPEGSTTSQSACRASCVLVQDPASASTQSTA